jgi:hypothetical protein
MGEHKSVAGSATVFYHGSRHQAVLPQLYEIFVDTISVMSSCSLNNLIVRPSNLLIRDCELLLSILILKHTQSKEYLNQEMCETLRSTWLTAPSSYRSALQKELIVKAPILSCVSLKRLVLQRLCQRGLRFDVNDCWVVASRFERC